MTTFSNGRRKLASKKIKPQQEPNAEADVFDKINQKYNFAPE